VIPVVVVDPALRQSPTMGVRRWHRFEAAVVALDRDLRAAGGRLILRSGDPPEVLARLVAETGAAAVVATRDFTPYAVRRDAAVAIAVPLHLHSGALVVEPEATGDVRVFTAFHRRWAAHGPGLPLPAPSRVSVPDDIASDPPPESPPRGGPEALVHLERFARENAAAYEVDRNRLDRDGTSGLAADLHLGTLSARRAAATVSSAAFVRQLAWRDWAHHQLWFGAAGGPGFHGRQAELRWRDDAEGVDAWKEGRTGYPTVDAAMRQLRAEGTMHNRARMIVASFLTKHLLVDWRVGEAHFLRELEDGDVANNRLGWRWTAGVGPDAAPFIRVFSPVLQGERFDPEGRWVRRWVPEIAGLPDAFVHRPWEAPGGLPPGYPVPIVDHATARARALAAFADRPRG
jgi:deoxyribodipyrimidine photo-lyase